MNFELFRLARDYGRYGILDSNKKVWFFRILIIAVIVYFIVRAVSGSAFALSAETYSNQFGTSSSNSQLLSLIPDNNYYVLFTASDSSTYVFYSSSKSDFVISGNNIIASHVHSIRQYNQNYQSQYIFDDDDDLNLTISKIFASNLDHQQASRSFTYSSESLEQRMKLILLVFLPILIFSNLRGRAHNEYN